jgi:hypothetical protein
MRFLSRASAAAFGLLILAGCSLLVDAGGLSGGADADAGDAAADAVPPPPDPPPPPGDAAVDAADGGRVTQGILALYTFAENGGTTVHDVSGYVTPLDLEIQTPDGGVATFIDAGLAITKPSYLTSTFAATKIIAACKASNEVTFEVWVTAANGFQSGARVAGVSGTNGDHNVGIVQAAHDYDTVLRSATTRVDLFASNKVKPTVMQHLVVTRAKDLTRIFYIDGVEAARDAPANANTSVWDDSFGMTGANSADFTASWLGTYHLIAVYGRALTKEEVARNFSVGPR